MVDGDRRSGNRGLNRKSARAGDVQIARGGSPAGDGEVVRAWRSHDDVIHCGTAIRSDDGVAQRNPGAPDAAVILVREGGDGDGGGVVFATGEPSVMRYVP